MGIVDQTGADAALSYQHVYALNTKMPLRETSAWYHIVTSYDLDNGTNADRMKIYVNGAGPYTGSFQSDQRNLMNANSHFNNASYPMHLGRYRATAGYMDGYIAEVHFLDGYVYDASYFGETKNGVWVPKDYKSVTGNYGSNGFFLEFKQTGTSANSSGIGADTSGNDNHFTVDGFVAADIVPDCPEKNMPIWNFLVNRRNGNKSTFSEGNTKVAGHSSQVAHTSSTIASKGKHYAEFYINNSSYAVTSCGVVRTMWDNGMGDSYASNYGGAYYSTNGTRAYNATSDSQTAPSSNRVGIEVDFAANEVQFFICESDGTKTAAGDKLTSSDGINFAGEGVFTATTHDVSSSYIEAYFNESDWYCTPASGYVELSSTNSIDDTDIVLGAHQAEQKFI